MKKRAIAWILSAALALTLIPGQGADVRAEEPEAPAQIEAEEGREKLNFNQGWKFVRQYIPEAVNVDYDMAELERWESVDLPHTVREEPYNSSGGKNYQGQAMYRKHFYLSESYAEKKLYIEFEAVMGVTDVWVNGEHLQGHMAAKTGENTQYGGYLPFVLDITDYVHCDGEANVITVLTDNSDNENVPPGKPQSQLDFTYFGGIYRNVWLHSVNPVHITDELYEDEVAGGGILIDYPQVSEETASADISTHVRNEEDTEVTVTVNTQIVDQEGEVKGEAEDEITLGAGEAETVAQELTVEDPHLWSLDDPYLHTVVSKVYVDGEETDRVETTTGIRTITMDTENGVLINGEHPGFLSGVNRHQEYPYIGYAASSSLQRKDAVKFKSAGFNIVRTAHHPQSEDFLEACDELGILVIESVPGWQHWSSDPVFAERVENDIRQMIRRDRNHPCIFTFEISLNESPGVPENFTNEMEAAAKEEGPSVRTSAENPHSGAQADVLYGTPDEVASWSDSALSLIREYGDFWEEQFGSFTDSCRVTRGEGSFYPGGEARMVIQANNRLWNGYTFNGTGSISLAEGIENYNTSNHRFAGVTMWIGIDHNRGYHETMSPCGLWDLMRIPKYSYYAFASQRPVEKDEYLESLSVETGPMLFVASSWSETAPVVDKSNGETMGTDESRLIYVYSNAETVKLSVMGADGEVLWESRQEPMTGESSGVAVMDNLDHPPFCFENVPYTEGSWLLAEGYDAEGHVIAEQEVHTAGEPAAIRLEVDSEGMDLTADGSDKVMVYAYVVDKDGNLCQDADNTIEFSVEGPGTIVGDGDRRVGSNPVKAEAGITGVYVEAGKTAGELRVTAESEGLENGTAEITAVPLEAKTVPCEEIAQGRPLDQVSMYLTEKEEVIPGNNAPSVSEGTVNLGGTDYGYSMEVKNLTPVSYELGGYYERLTGKAAFRNPEKAGADASFRIYGDGSLLYDSGAVADGIAEIDVDISGVQNLTLVAGDEGCADELTPCWLSLYVTEGSGVTDESELRQNLALNARTEASGSDEGTSPADAVDGDSLTLWRSAEDVTEENPQTLTVDLGAKYDVRNARVGVEFDYLRCTYSIYTSPDQKEWTLQSTSSKTAHGNGELDSFTAEGVRYVKVEFTEAESTQGESGGAAPRASISELEVYLDKGVETVKDYNLAGLAVAGHDLVFSPYQTEYEISLNGEEEVFWLKAFPANRESTVAVNGEKVDLGTADTLEEMDYLMAAPGEDGTIAVQVTSPDGNGVKDYVIRINGENRQSRYDAQDALVPGVNGAGQWSYGKLDTASGEVTEMADENGGFIAGEYAWHEGDNWLYAGPRYMHPDPGTDAVRTFTAPKAGNVTLTVTAQKYQDQPGDVSLRILKNGEKVWPADGDAETLSQGEVFRIKKTISAEQGDRIQIALGSSGDNGGDATWISSCAEYTEGDGDNVAYLSDLEWESAEAGYGEVRRDAPAEGFQIALTGSDGQPVLYEKGIGTHAQSKIVYNIEGKGYTRFLSDVGVDYSRNPNGYDANVVFKVYFNDENTEPVYDSGEMYCDTSLQSVDLALDETVTKLILVVEQGVNNYSDHADWAGARFLTEEEEEPEEPEEPETADKTALNLVIAMAEKLEAQQAETGCYTEETWAAVQTALDAARALAENGEASQEDVDNAFLELITAVNLLENAVQRVALKTAIEGAGAILADEEALQDYTPESVENLRNVLAEAERVYAEVSTDQETVNAASRSLMDAVTSLVVIDKDTRLDILIQKAEELLASADQYTAASVGNLRAALDEARLTADDRDASEGQINAAYSSLAEAMSSLVRKADKSELQTALDKAAEILADTSKYVEESVAGLQAAAGAAQAVYDQEDADAAAVGEAVKSLVDEILKARLMGDVDGNGTVDSADSAEVLSAAAEAQTLDGMQSLAADVNGDGAADSSDAAEILVYAAEAGTGF